MKKEAYIYNGKIKEIKIELVSSTIENEEKNKTDVFGCIIKMEIDGDIKELICSYILSAEYIDKECYALILNDNQFYMILNKKNVYRINYFSYFQRLKGFIVRNYVLLLLAFLCFYKTSFLYNSFTLIIMTLLFIGCYIKEKEEKNKNGKIYFKVVNLNLRELFLLKKILK